MSESIKLQIKLNDSTEELVTLFVTKEYLEKVPDAESRTLKDLILLEHNIFEHLHNTNGASLVWSKGTLYNINGEFVTGDKRAELIRRQNFHHTIEDFLNEE